MDIANSLAPRSDQINADDLVHSPMDVTIREVVNGKGDQPYDFLLMETDRAYRPNVTMRRLISAAWGTTDGDSFVGRRLRLYCAKVPDPGGKGMTNGIRVSHLSHIDQRFETKLQVSRGRRETFTVDPLPDAPPALTDAMIACCTDVQQLGDWWREHPGQRAAIEARVAEIKAADDIAANTQGGEQA